MGSWLEPCFGLGPACTPAGVLPGVPQAAESLEEGALADPHKGCSQAEAVEEGSLPAEKKGIALMTRLHALPLQISHSIRLFWGTIFRQMEGSGLAGNLKFLVFVP